MIVKRFTYLSSKYSGFTLLELLLATMIMGLLLGSIYTVFFGAVKLRDSSERVVSAELKHSYIISILKQDLTGMVAPVGVLAGAILGETNEVGRVKHDSLEFFSSNGIIGKDDSWGDIQKVEYYLAESEEPEAVGFNFIRVTTRNLLASVEEEPEEEILLKNVDALTITYFDGNEWLDTWDSTALENAAPMAVKIRFDFYQDRVNDQDAIIVAPLEVISQIAAKGLSSPGNNNENAS